MAIRNFLFLGTILVAAMLGSSRADAHAVLLEKSVGDGARLAVAPAEIRLRFNESVTPVLVRVLDAQGHPMTTSDAVSEVDSTVILAMPKALPAGNYVFTYRVISADSHPVGGSFVFGLGDAAPEPGLDGLTAGSSHEMLWTRIASALQAIFYGGLLFAVGGALFQVIIARDDKVPRAERNFMLGAAAVASVAILAAIGVEGALSADVPLTDIVDPDIWRIGLQTSLSANAFVTIAGLAILSVGAIGWAQKFDRAVLLGGGLLAIVGITITGHAASASPAWLSAPVLGLHALCAAYWVGALVPLHRRIWKESVSVAAAQVRLFSSIALIVVAVLVVCGLVLAAVQVREFSALVTTDYGQRLLVKLLLVAVLLGCAAFNKFRFTPRLALGDTRVAMSLRRMIEVELALVVAIIVATALLGETTPPRALQEQAAEHLDMDMSVPGFSVATFAGNRIAVVDVSPARAGNNTLGVSLLDADGSLITPVQVTVFLSNPALGIEPSEHRAVAVSRGRYSVADAGFPTSGRWRVEIEVLVTDFEAANFSTEVPIP